MANVIDYLNWRGDLPFGQVPVNDVDLLVFARLSYVPWAGIVPAGIRGAVPFGEAADRVLKARSPEEFRQQDRRLVTVLRGCGRFAGTRLCGFVDRFDPERSEQFAAMTFLVPDVGTVISYRGTDGTLVGWKEDLNMSFSRETHAQRDALAYAVLVMEAAPGPWYLTGHSKGGNLAVYAAAGAGEEKQRRIAAVRSFDGPGFLEDTVSGDAFAGILPRTRTVVPESSVIGVLLEHAEEFDVVESRGVSVFQHDIYQWEVLRDDFRPVAERTSSSRFVDRTMRDFLYSMTPEQREKGTDALFRLLGAGDSRTLADVFSGRGMVSMLRELKGMDPESRETLTRCFRMLKASAKESLPLLLERLSRRRAGFAGDGRDARDP